MTLKNRLAKLEKQANSVHAWQDNARRIDYRAGIVPNIPDPAGTLISVCLVEWKSEAENEHKEPTDET